MSDTPRRGKSNFIVLLFAVSLLEYLLPQLLGVFLSTEGHFRDIA
jgi:hypothetical protein